jgi:hypothetical protein
MFTAEGDLAVLQTALLSFKLFLLTFCIFLSQIRKYNADIQSHAQFFPTNLTTSSSQNSLKLAM